ncbi:ATP-binding cassette domain-containing protein [Rhodobacter capsulatus]|uniref:ATP-binding cassette domain-containing protein n=1 Tax=Rhodobacter capsulatus TaxID=1061 RepID=UPI0003D37727|nr:ATP-binding cassette domain-containing protein [Rhodobacter capsulatus]ETD87283.1 ABC transporter ATP-binding protein [Rhodobacter capsulatus YW2]
MDLELQDVTIFLPEPPVRGSLLRRAGRSALQPLITAFNLRIAPGEVVALMGQSGSGKSTLLSFIAGSLGGEFRASGRVLIGSRDLSALPPRTRRIGILFQDDLLFPHLSVGDNLAFGLPAEAPRPERKRLILEALDEAGLAGFAARDPASLSGGQRARVALLRTLLSQPQALLLDEPFSKLDMALRDGMRRFVFDLAVRRNFPVLLVTHDLADAAAAHRRISDWGAFPECSAAKFVS